MPKTNIRIEHIKIKDLIKFAEDAIGSAQEGGFIPITMQRAVSHANNPYAAEDDIALLAAIDSDDEVVGFFGIMPLMLRTGDKLTKVHWFTTWSVSPKVRGQGVGSRLMQEALTLNKDYLIVGSIHARRVSHKYGFWDREPLTYYWLDTTGLERFNPLTIVMRLFRKIGHILHIGKPVEITNAATKFVDRALAPLTRRFFYALLSKAQADILENVRWGEVDQIRDYPSRKTPSPGGVELHRGIDVVNWMLSHPWIVESGQSPTEKMNYYFTDAKPMYRLVALEVHSREDEYKGFVIFVLSKNNKSVKMRVLDFCFSDPADYRYVLALALKFGRQSQADIIEMPAEVAKYLQGGILGKLLLIEKKRIYQCMPKSDDSPLAQAWEDLTLNLCDGDMAFS